VFCSFLDQVEINRFFAKKIKKIKVQDRVKSGSNDSQQPVRTGQMQDLAFFTGQTQPIKFFCFF